MTPSRGSRKEPEKPWFAWVHLYDPHLPIRSSAGLRPRISRRSLSGRGGLCRCRIGPSPELSEIVRARLAHRSSFLQGIMAKASATTESSTTVCSSTRPRHSAPLIITHPAMPSAGARRQEVVSLVDILPTIAEATGLPLPENVQGQSLWPLIGGDGVFDEKPVYAETHYPKLHFGWSPLTALQDRTVPADPVVRTGALRSRRRPRGRRRTSSGQTPQSRNA